MLWPKYTSDVYGLQLRKYMRTSQTKVLTAGGINRVMKLPLRDE